MKITAKQYAQSLFEATKDASEKEAKEATKKLAEVLVSNNQTSQLEKVLDYFSSLWNKEKGILEAEIISSNKLDNDTKKVLLEFIDKKTKGKEVEIKETVDKKIKGGFVIRLGDEILDSSLSTRIKELKKSLIN